MMQRLLFLLLMFCGAVDLRAVNLLVPPDAVPAADGSTVLRWRLDSPAGGKVRYGLSADKLDQTASDAVSAEHSVTLRGLQPGRKYFYSVGTSRNTLTTGSFIAGGTAAPAEKPTVLEKITRIIPKPAPQPVTPPVSPKVIVRDAPATRLTWGNMASLQDHFARHSGDFGAKSPDDYAAQAWRFRERAVAEHLPMKLDTDGTVRAWDPKSRAFASYNRDGTTKTYFRPDSPSYWQRQPGRSIQTPPWVSQ